MEQQQNATITMPEKGRVMIYACGGAGVNIGQSTLMKYVGQAGESFANVSMGFIDTSYSNFKADTPRSSCYVIENTDGSGGLRSANYPEIQRRTKDILQRLRPLDFNIVISSGGGGSGSVIAPCIVEELLHRKLPTIVILVGGCDTYKRADNTLKTLQSYELIARNTGIPVCLCYQENSDVTPIKTVNQSISSFVSVLTAVFSRRNRGLDLADVTNWLNFPLVTTHGPQLAAVDFCMSNNIENVDKIINILTLAEDGSFESLPFMSENHYIGYMDKAPVTMAATLPIHCVIRTGAFKEVASRLKSMVEELKEQQNARVAPVNGILDDSGLLGGGSSIIL
jgi:hypothetical protein